MDKIHIISEIKRIAKENGGKAPGSTKFERETGIKTSVWQPHIWLRWGDALQEAGFSPNKMQSAFSDEFVFRKIRGPHSGARTHSYKRRADQKVKN